MAVLRSVNKKFLWYLADFVHKEGRRVGSGGGLNEFVKNDIKANVQQKEIKELSYSYSVRKAFIFHLILIGIQSCRTLFVKNREVGDRDFT